MHFLYVKLIQCWCCIDLWLIRGWGGGSLPLVYVHSAICETDVV